MPKIKQPHKHPTSVSRRAIKQAVTTVNARRKITQQKVAPLEAAPVPPTDVSAILDDRGARYGKFRDHARVSIALTDIISDRLQARGVYVTVSQAEALRMICHKIARIANGDPNYADSWVDIAGYAMLVADELNGVMR